jgi:hypothetical protein
MNNSDLRQVLSRLSDDEFFDREADLDALYSLATGRARHETAARRDDGANLVMIKFLKRPKSED